MGGYTNTPKKLRSEVTIPGIEPNPLMAEQARPHYNDLIVRPIEEVHLDKKFDLVNCGHFGASSGPMGHAEASACPALF